MHNGRRIKTQTVRKTTEECANELRKGSARMQRAGTRERSEKAIKAALSQKPPKCKTSEESAYQQAMANSLKHVTVERKTSNGREHKVSEDADMQRALAFSLEPLTVEENSDADLQKVLADSLKATQVACTVCSTQNNLTAVRCKACEIWL